LNDNRIAIYSFLSTIYSGYLNTGYLNILKQNQHLLDTIGEKSRIWITKHKIEDIEQLLKHEYQYMFEIEIEAKESLTFDENSNPTDKIEKLYKEGDYKINKEKQIYKADHISVELSFMKHLILKNNKTLQKRFLKEHLLCWSIPFLIAIIGVAKSDFYKEVIGFTIVFLASDYERLTTD
jgi:TorA maturation chaperone TorD